MRCLEQLLSAVSRSSKEQAHCNDSDESSGSTPRASDSNRGRARRRECHPLRYQGVLRRDRVWRPDAGNHRLTAGCRSPALGFGKIQFAPGAFR